MDSPDPCSPAFKHVLLRDARIDFAEFYRTATPADEVLMDGLLFAYAALTVAINSPRAGVAPAILRELERATNASEQYFTGLRQQVRCCDTFVMLMRAERAQIEKAVFVVRHPSSG